MVYLSFVFPIWRSIFVYFVSLKNYPCFLDFKIYLHRLLQSGLLWFKTFFLFQCWLPLVTSYFIELCSLPFFFFKDFIYPFDRKEREHTSRGNRRGRSRLPNEQGLLCDPGLTEPPRHPLFFCCIKLLSGLFDVLIF